MGDFTLRWLSVPYLVLMVSLLVLAGFAVLSRGAQLIRVALLFLVMAGLPYTVAVAMCASVTDPNVANVLSRFGVGAVSILGVSLMMVLFVINGRFEQHRRVFVVAALIATTTAAITWSTKLVVADSWRTSWGLWAHHGGPLSDVHIGQFVLWPVIAMVLIRRGNRGLMDERRRHLAKFVAAGLAVALLGVTDSLLTRGIGVYSFSFVPATLAVWFAIYACARLDLLRSQGLDWAGLWELVIVAVVAVLVALFFAVAQGSPQLTSPLVTSVVLVPLLLTAYITALLLRTRSREHLHATERQDDIAIDLFIEHAREVRTEVELRDRFSSLLTDHLQLADIRLYRQQESGLWATQTNAELPPVKLDARVRAWLLTNKAPLISDELLTQSLGGLRKPIESFMSIIHADVVVPLVDRDRIVALAVTSARRDERGLHEGDKSLLMQAASASARAMTYLRLVSEAREKIEIAKEVEVAVAVQQARTPGEQTLSYGNHEIISYYQPAAQFGGHWWVSDELPDGRILIVIGDVTGHGVSAALISFTVEGACETAQRMFGANFEVLSLLQLLNQEVLEVGKGRYAMSCFAAIIDPEAKQVVFANAGHPFPYICRHSESPKRGKAELRSLVSRGTPLGTEDPVLGVSTMDLEADDVLVFFSDSIVDSQNPEGQSYGDRRFQRILRTQVRDANRAACDVIMHDAHNFYGNRPINDDINLVVVRLGVK